MKTPQYLSKINQGIVLSEEVIENILNKKQMLIVNSSLYRGIINKPIYVINNNKCYGIVNLKCSDKITIEEFGKMKDKHCLTDEHRKKWWPNKKILFTYSVDKVLSKFDKPRCIESSSKAGDFVVKDFTFSEGELSEKNLQDCYNIIENIDNIESSSTTISVNQLSDSELKKVTMELGFQYYNFENIYEAVEHMFVSGSEFVVEQDHEGVECTLIKRADTCSLYSYKKRDMSSFFPDIINQAKRMSDRDFALDCRISIENKTVKEVKKMIDDEVVYENDDVKLNVVDCLFYDLDVRNLEYRERKQLLKSMTYTESIYETPYLFVDNSADAMQSFNVMRMVNDNVVIKNNDEHKAYKISTMSESAITNHDFFAKQSGPMMYYLGFLCSDGHVDTKTNRVEIHISKDDSEIIKSFQKLLGDKRNITNGFLKFKSKKMVEDLAKYDMSKLKPQRRTQEKIPSQYKWDFIRGAFDADGTISKEKLQFDSGNRTMVKWMYNQLKTIGGEHVKYYEYDSTSKCTVYEKAVKRVHSKIYSGSGPSLQRKKSYLQDKSMSEGVTKENDGETTTLTSGVSSIQGKKWKDKVSIPAKVIKEKTIKNSSEDINKVVQLKQVEDLFYVESFNLSGEGEYIYLKIIKEE